MDTEQDKYKFYGVISHEILPCETYKGSYTLHVKDDGRAKIFSGPYSTVEDAEHSAEWIKNGALLDREEGVHWRMFVLTNVDGVDRDFKPFRQEKIRAQSIDIERFTP